MRRSSASWPQEPLILDLSSATAAAAPTFHPNNRGLSAGASNWSTPVSTGNAADSADPDGDGVANFLEYTLGGDPLVASRSDLPVIALNTDPSPKLQLTFLRARSDVIYTVRGSSNLTDWSDLVVNPGTISLTTPVTVTDSTTAAPLRFLRLKVSAP